MQQNHPPGCLTYNLNLYCVPITLCLDGPDVQEGKRRSIARVTIACDWTVPHISGCIWHLLWYPVSWMTAADAQRANCEAPERAGADRRHHPCKHIHNHFDRRRYQDEL